MIHIAFENQKKGFKLLKFVGKIQAGTLSESEKDELFKTIGEYGYSKESIEGMADNMIKTMSPKEKKDLIAKSKVKQK